MWDYVYSGIYEFTKEVMVFATKVAIHTYIEITIFAYEVAFDVVQDFIADLGIAARVESAYSSIPSPIRDGLSFFGVPQALVIIGSAIPTRIAMRFIPFIGR
ncbi:hypothetical protein D3C78_1787160 [compost metagenome]